MVESMNSGVEQSYSRRGRIGRLCGAAFAAQRERWFRARPRHREHVAIHGGLGVNVRVPRAAFRLSRRKKDNVTVESPRRRRAASQLGRMRPAPTRRARATATRRNGIFTQRMAHRGCKLATGIVKSCLVGHCKGSSAIGMNLASVRRETAGELPALRRTNEFRSQRTDCWSSGLALAR